MHWIRRTTLTWGSELRLRRRRGLRRPRGQRERITLHGCYGHLPPGRPARGGDCPRRTNRRTPPTGHQRPRHKPRRRVPALILARLAARTACAGPHPYPALRPPWCYRHDSLVTDRRSPATLICDGAARSCFHTQASLSRSVIGSAGRQAAGSSRSIKLGPKRAQRDASGEPVPSGQADARHQR
jgi:hypothetical protein